MFDIGFSELLLIAVVALVVLGPERLPKAARLAGLWLRRARAQWYSVKAELERDLAAEELRRSLHETRETVHGVEQTMRAVGTDLRRDFDLGRRDDAGTDLAPADAPRDGPQPDDPSATDGDHDDPGSDVRR